MPDRMQKKIGFWAVFSLVLGSQIGSGVFASPAVLAPYGLYGLLGWCFSGVFAVTLAVIFAKLCMQFPRTGGPHVYAYEAFGEVCSFFTGWSYWLISWMTTPVVLVTSVSYLSTLISIKNPIFWQIGILCVVTAINLRSVQASGRAEFVLTLFKFIPLTVIPIIALCFFDKSNIQTVVSMTPASMGNILMLTLFCFLGLESATAPAEFVEQPQKTIPKAIIWGTVSVALIYLLNSAAILGLIQGAQLMNSKAPYVDATRLLFGDFSFIMGIIGTFVCISTLNAWVLTSSQIAYGLSKDLLFPDIFKIKNKMGTPFVSVLISSVLIIPVLILTNHENVGHQIATIIDYGMIIVLFIYAIASLALVRVSQHKMLGIVGLLLCMGIIIFRPLHEILTGIAFILSGVPMYIYVKRKK